MVILVMHGCSAQIGMLCELPVSVVEDFEFIFVKSPDLLCMIMKIKLLKD